MKKKRTCYMFECDRYTQCELSAGSCCAIEADAFENGVTAQECGKSQGYKLFREKRKTFFDPEDMK